MNELLFHALNLSGAASSALVSAIWQGAMLAALVLAVLRMFPGLSASARSFIWLNVFILLALLHVVPFLMGEAANPAKLLAGHLVRLDPRWSVAFTAVWLAFSIARAAQLFISAVHLRRLGRRAVAMEPAAELVPLLRHHGEAVRLCISNEVARPSVLGFFRPRILLPAGITEKLTAAELRQVVLHEMEHLRRGDDWTNLIQKVALVLFPLNPALAWVERRLCAERELACDDSVLRSGPGRKAYALCLAHLAEISLLRRSFSLVLGAWERRPELVRRVHRILAEPVRSMGRSKALVATGGLVAGALGCALVLAHSPQVVSFSPVAQPMQQALIAPLDANELGRELGGKPEFVKTVIPEPSHAAGPASGHDSRVRPAISRRAGRKPNPATRLAGLRMPPPPGATLLVMTDWNGLELPPPFVFAVSPIERSARQQMNTQGRRPAPVPVIRAAFAVVRTPDGWLVIQI